MLPIACNEYLLVKTDPLPVCVAQTRGTTVSIRPMRRSRAPRLGMALLLGIVVGLGATTMVATSQPASAAATAGDVVFSKNGDIWLRHGSDGRAPAKSWIPLAGHDRL